MHSQPATIWQAQKYKIRDKYKRQSTDYDRPRFAKPSAYQSHDGQAQHSRNKFKDKTLATLLLGAIVLIGMKYEL